VRRGLKAFRVYLTCIPRISGGDTDKTFNFLRIYSSGRRFLEDLVIYIFSIVLVVQFFNVFCGSGSGFGMLTLGDGNWKFSIWPLSGYCWRAKE